MNNIFISILSGKGCRYSIELNEYLNHNKYASELIIDNISMKNILLNNNYYGLTKIFPDIPTAWEFSISNIVSKKLYEKYDYFFFIEDDVYSKKYSTFIDCISSWNMCQHDFIGKKIRSKNEEPEWIWWKEKTNWNTFDNPYKSFNTISRISSRLIKKIIEYQNIYNKFIFHEILFISLCVKNDYSFIDYEDNLDLKKFIHINTVIPELSDDQIIYDNKLYHPYKKILTVAS